MKAVFKRILPLYTELKRILDFYKVHYKETLSETGDLKRFEICGNNISIDKLIVDLYCSRDAHVTFEYFVREKYCQRTSSCMPSDESKFVLVFLLPEIEDRKNLIYSADFEKEIFSIWDNNCGVTRFTFKSLLDLKNEVDLNYVIASIETIAKQGEPLKEFAENYLGEICGKEKSL